MPSNKTLTAEQILAILTETPKRIVALAGDLTAVQLRRAPAPEEWSVNDALAHLRSCADVWGDSMARILAEDAPAIRAVNPRMWILQKDYPDLDFRPSLRAFITQRAALLKLLEPLQYKEWTRSATVMGAGKPLQLTVLDYARRMALHERPHIKQIARMVEALR
jgi:hypothetical protein